MQKTISQMPVVCEIFCTFAEKKRGMSQRYALFFDIDGTLVSFKTHEIPPSTIFALTQAKANGSRVYIATGRPPVIITNLGAIEHLIDGYITTNGALCFVGDELVCCQPIPMEDVMTCVDDCLEKATASLWWVAKTWQYSTPRAMLTVSSVRCWL